MKKMFNKKNIILAIVLITSFSLSFGVAYAYMSGKDTIKNKFSVAEQNVSIYEEFNGSFGTKEVSFKNESTKSPVLLRISYNESWCDGDNYVSNTINGVNVVDKGWTNEFLNDFVLGNDGWYYYKKVLNASTSVKVLNTITLNNSYYERYDYDLTFNYEAVQTDNGASLELWGVDSTVNGDDVSWNF